MIRVALIECDRPNEFAAALRQVPSLKCTVIVDGDEAKCAPASRELGSRQIAGVEQLLSEAADTFDVAVVEAPIELRAERASQLAQYGKPVCVVFPPAATLEQWTELAERFRAARVKLMVGCPLRSGEYAHTIQASLQSRKLGEPGLLRMHYWTNQDLSDPVGESSVLELAGAQVDTACWLFADRPDSVYAVSVEQAGQVRNGVQIHLGFPNGGMASIGCIVAPQAEPYSMVTLVGSRGAAYADDHHNTNLLIKDRSESLTVGQGVEGFSRLLHDFVDLVDGDERQGRATDDVQRVYVVAQAVANSVRTGRAATRIGERYELR